MRRQKGEEGWDAPRAGVFVGGLLSAYYSDCELPMIKDDEQESGLEVEDEGATHERYTRHIEQEARP